MEDVSLIRLERIARNMPVKQLAMHRIEGDYGVIYFAYGDAPDGTIHGIWGYNDVARTIEFKEGTSVADVRQTLVTDAMGNIEQFMDAGVINGH